MVPRRPEAQVAAVRKRLDELAGWQAEDAPLDHDALDTSWDGVSILDSEDQGWDESGEFEDNLTSDEDDEDSEEAYARAMEDCEYYDDDRDDDEEADEGEDEAEDENGDENGEPGV